jgi:hypothetical protein
MHPFPVSADYPLNQEEWGKTFRPNNPEMWTEPIIDNHIALSILRYRSRGYTDFDLWEEFRESFEGWTIEILETAHRIALKELRTYLVTHGVWVRKQVGSISFAKTLQDVIDNDVRHEWTEEEIREVIDSGKEFHSKLNSEYQETRTTIEHDRTVTNQSQNQENREQNEITRTPTRTTLRPGQPPRDETPCPPSRPYRQFNDTPHPSLRPETVIQTPIVRRQTTTPYDQPYQISQSKLLADLMKIYNNDDKKYGGEEYDILDIKLQVFYDCCTKVGLPDNQFHLAFSIMLKGRASSFYYDKISGRSYDYPTMVEMTKTHFETEERRQKYLTEWRSTTLYRTITRHPEKSQPECLEILFDTLRTTQRGLSIEYQNEYNLRDQVINACSGVPECRSALFRPASTFEGVCAELRSAIGQVVREKELKELTTFHQDKDDRDLPNEHVQHWTDRTYGGRGRYPSRTNFRTRGKFQNKGNFRGNSRFSWNPGNRNYQQKKCFVCGQLGCWSTKHSEEERKKSYEQFVTENEVTEEDYKQFLQEFEGTSDDLEDDQWIMSLDIKDALYDNDVYITELGEINGPKTVSVLNDRSYEHAITKEDVFTQPQETSIFTFEDRYSSGIFQGIMPDSGASGVSTVGEPQFLALQKLDPKIQLDRTKAGDHRIRFGKGTALSKGIVKVETPLGQITFHVVPTNTPFLYCIQDMDKMGVKLDNLKNVLIQGIKSVPIVRKWGHPWMLLHRTEETMAYSHLTEVELRQLHRRFGHPSVQRLTKVLQRAGYNDIDPRTIERLTKFCKQCQLHSKSPGRFKFTLKDDRNFNYSVLIDVLYLDNKPVLQAIDEATAFNAARFLKDMSAKTAWDTVRVCWIDMYQGPPDYFIHDAGKNFSSVEFRQHAYSMATEVKEVPVEAHNSVGKVERYHGPLRRSYEILRDELQDEKLDKELILQMAVKAVNDTAGPDGLVPTLLVFGAYPRITPYDAPSPTIIKRAEAIRTAMKELRRFYAERQVKDALAARNGPNTAETLNIPLQSDVRVWRERKGWKGPYKLIATDGETCTVEMPYGPTNFRTTVVKPFHIEKVLEKQLSEIQPRRTITPMFKTPEYRTTRPVVEIPVFINRKEQFDLDLSLDLRQRGIITTPGQPFQASQKQEIDALIAKEVFEFIPYDRKIHIGRIFNSRFVDEVKGKATKTPYEKSRLVIQAYNDEGKEVILTQSPTIQRASQRVIVALAPSLVRQGIKLFLRDVTQAYVQSTTFLNRQILAYLPKELETQFPPNTIMIVRRPLYGVPEAGTHWWATYHKHHQEKLQMTTSSYDPCLLITTTKDAFGVVGMQTDDTLILGDNNFTRLEDNELMKANIKAKPTEALSYDSPLIFNGCILRQEDNAITLVQKNQGAKLKLIDQTATLDELQNQYREQRARGAYIATICQPEALFDLSIAAQHQEPSYEDVKALNKRIKWQIENLTRGIKYIELDLNRTKLFVFVDGSFANNKDFSSQIGYEIILANETTNASYEENSFNLRGNLIHYSSTKSKRVTRSVLASEIYGMVGGIDMAIAINTTIKIITDQLGFPSTPIIVCTDSYSLYECLVKLGTTKEKRLMIDIMAIRQSYERRELTEIRWINGQDNPADAMTKGTPNKALEKFIDTNELSVRIEGWVKREEDVGKDLKL